LGVLWCVIFLLWFRDDPAQHPAVNAAERELLTNSRVLPTHADESSWLRLLLTRQIAILVLQYFCFSFVWYFYITWLPTYLRESRGQSPERAAFYAMLPLLLGGFGSLTGGVASRLFPKRTIALCGFAATAVLLLAFIHIRQIGPAMAVMALASFSSDLTMPISWDTCVEIGGPYTATLAATMNMLGNLAGFAAPVIGGFILEKQSTTAGWHLLIDTMIGAATISAACWLFLDPEANQNEGAKEKKPATLDDSNSVSL